MNLAEKGSSVSSSVPRMKQRLAAIALVALTAMVLIWSPTAGSAAAPSGPGAAYGKAIEKARTKRAAHLRSCEARPTARVRAACKRAAESAFVTDLEEAQIKRAESGNPDR